MIETTTEGVEVRTLDDYEITQEVVDNMMKRGYEGEVGYRMFHNKETNKIGKVYDESYESKEVKELLDKRYEAVLFGITRRGLIEIHNDKKDVIMKLSDDDIENLIDRACENLEELYDNEIENMLDEQEDK